MRRPSVVDLFGEPDRWVIHKQAAWLCLGAAMAAGFSIGFAVATLVLVVLR